MEDAHVIPGEDESEEKEGKPLKKVLIGAGIVVFLLLIGGGSYFVGRRGRPTEEEPSEEESVAEAQSPTVPPTPTTVPGLTGSPTSTPSPTPTPIIKTKTISSSASVDGFRSSNGGGNDAIDIRAGRNQFLVTRGFVSFDLSSIPSGSTITKATLRLYQTKTESNPYGIGGNLLVDHLNYGVTLDNADYASAALLSSFATLTNNTTVEWKDATVTSEVQDDVDNGRERSQYRIHFATENKGGDVTGDFAYFEAAENTEGTGNTPELVVKYY